MIKKIIGIGILVCILIFGISFYFTFVYVPSGEEFDIKYLNLEKISSKGTPQEEKVEFRERGLYTRTNFTKNNEELTYKFDVLNDGTLDAILKYKPIYLRRDMYTKKHISYHITYLDDSEINAGDEIKVGETKTFKVHIKYTNSDTVTQNSQFFESLVWLVYVRK